MKSVRMREQAPAERRVLSEKITQNQYRRKRAERGTLVKRGERKAPQKQSDGYRTGLRQLLQRWRCRKWHGPREDRGAILFACSQTYPEYPGRPQIVFELSFLPAGIIISLTFCRLPGIN